MRLELTKIQQDSNVVERLGFGRPLATQEEGEQRVGPAARHSHARLDALRLCGLRTGSRDDLLIPSGAMGLRWIGPIISIITGLLLIVYFSYRQTIGAYPTGGDPISRRNLGVFPSCLQQQRSYSITC